MKDLQLLKDALFTLKSAEKARHSARFFKTGKGDYGEHDLFLGITVPEQRKVATTYRDLPLSDVVELLKSPFHEERLVALLILIQQYQKGTMDTQKQLADVYLCNTAFVNNWDLVDASAHHILGHFVFHYEKDLSTLLSLARSTNLWERRIAIVATLYFIKQNDSKAALTLSKLLLKDPHDLIQKAVGWMLREMGKRVSLEELERFMNQHHKTMPRTTLRYAIERMSPQKKAIYMAR